MAIRWDDEASQGTPTSRIAWDDTTPPSQPSQPVNRLSKSPFDSPAARLLFPGIGGTAGLVAGGGATVASGGALTPLAFAGATSGAGLGEAIRQVLASFSGGGPASMTEAIANPLQQAAVEATGHAVGPMLRAGAKQIGRVSRLATARVGQMTTPIAPESFERVFERGAQNVITPEYQAFAKGGVPERIQTNVIKGLDRFRTVSEDNYEKSLTALKPQMKSLSINLKGITDRMAQRLQQASVLNEQGKPQRTLLGAGVVPSASRSNQKLVSVLKRLQQMQGKPLPLEKAIRLKREVDTLLDFDPNAVSAISKQGQAILFSLRASLKEATEEALPALKGANDEYHLFRDLYDAIQPRLKDPNIESTLRSLTRSRNTFNFRILQEIDQLVPANEKFLVQTLDFLAGSEFGKDPELFRFLPFAITGALTQVSGGGPLATSAALLAGAEATSPRALGATLRVMEPIHRAAVGAGRAVLPGLPPGASGVMRLLRGSQEPTE